MKIRIIFFLLLTFYIIPANVEGLREIKAGDKITADAELSFLKGYKTPVVLVYLNSSKTKSIAFLKQMLKAYGNKKNSKLIIADSLESPDKRLSTLLNDNKISAKIINDNDRKIYGKLGIIVIPTTIFIRKDKTLNSFIAGYRANLGIFFKSHLKAMSEGKLPEDVYKKFDRQLKLRQEKKMLKQAFKLILENNYDLSYSVYSKALKQFKDSSEAKFGMGYSLFKKGKTAEAVDFFKKFTSENKKNKILLGLYITLATSKANEENLNNLHHYALLEPLNFPALFDAAEILEKNNKTKFCIEIYRHAYKALLRRYRKNR